MSTCGTCWRVFRNWNLRQQHTDATGHCPPSYECETCDRFFISPRAVSQHMNAVGHWAASFSTPDEPDNECGHCYLCFCTPEDLRDHEVKEHFYCDPCDRHFQNLNCITQHLHSKLHRTSFLKCLFCCSEHGTATGLVYHLESGSCPNAPLSRDKLYDAVRSRDPDGVISKKLLTWSGSIDYEATERAWNPEIQAYQCYLCARRFDRLMSLNQHLISPVHQQSLYHCPNRCCRKNFTTLAAVINHLESESCRFMRFEAVQLNVERILDPRRMIQATSMSF